MASKEKGLSRLQKGVAKAHRLLIAVDGRVCVFKRRSKAFSQNRPCWGVVMIRTDGPGYVAVAPHAKAAQAAAAILAEGGNAIEAMVSAAAVIAVVYPHMTGLGGDGFWLIHNPGGDVQAIDASGPTGANATPAFFENRGVQRMPTRGPLAASTVAGTVSGWDLALRVSRSWGGTLPLSRLMEEAIEHAACGVIVSESQARSTLLRHAELHVQPGFSDHYMNAGRGLAAGTLMRQPALAETLRELARGGLQDFYSGAVGSSIASDLSRVGSPITASDVKGYRAKLVAPLFMAHRLGALYNLPPPTQGVLSLMILGILDRLDIGRYAVDSADMIHYAVEATKRAFALRDSHKRAFLTPSGEASDWLSPPILDSHAKAIDPDRAAPWRAGDGPADTVWMGVIDKAGRAVSFIQSLYHEFGSGVVLPATGICWQNRGASFSLEPGVNRIGPSRAPYHTLNPMLARLKDGRVLAFGAMGGDGQPQSLAAIFTRVATFGVLPEAAISAPRWLLGRSWGDVSDTLKIESRFPETVIAELVRRGHEVERLAAFDELVGHAGLVMHTASYERVGAADPRSDGAVIYGP